MAEENNLEQPKKSKTMLIVIIVVGLNLVIGGVVVFVMMGSNSGEAAQAAAPKAVRSTIGPGPIIQQDNFVVNIQSDEGAKYLKAALAIELADPSVQEEFNKWDKLVRNEILIYLSSLEVAETITAKQKRIIENTMKDIVNKRIGSEIVTGVYFTEFVTQ